MTVDLEAGYSGRDLGEARAIPTGGGRARRVGEQRVKRWTQR